MTRFVTRSNRGSPGLGVSATSPRRPASRCATIDGGTRSCRPRPASTRSASSNVDGSGAVGPDAMTSSGSPMTSDRTSVSTSAGMAARASCPPLSTERCLRTALSALIVAPASSKSRVVACFSCRVIGGAGAGVSAEPPPEISTTTRSSAPARRARSSRRWAARWPRSSGTGWPASARRIRRVGPVWPSLTTTKPSAMRSAEYPLHRSSHRRPRLAAAEHDHPAKTLQIPRPGTGDQPGAVVSECATDERLDRGGRQRRLPDRGRRLAGGHARAPPHGARSSTAESLTSPRTRPVQFDAARTRR